MTRSERSTRRGENEDDAERKEAEEAEPVSNARCWLCSAYHSMLSKPANEPSENAPSSSTRDMLVRTAVASTKNRKRPKRQHGDGKRRKKISRINAGATRCSREERKMTRKRMRGEGSVERERRGA